MDCHSLSPFQRAMTRGEVVADAREVAAGDQDGAHRA
jgi:hypothetical protein